MQYRLISADSHVVEPPDLWSSRVPQRFRARAPHQVRMEKGDAWVIEGLPQPFPYGLVQCGGLPREQYRLWVRWEEVRPEASQPGPRLAALDEASCDAEVMYPSPRIQNAIAENESDPELQVACVRAYNDWLSEFCSAAPQRFSGVALLPNVGVPAALAELERALALPGMRSVLMSRFPHGGTSFSDEDDPFWARCAERRVPVNVHVGLSGSPSGTPALGHTFNNAFTGAFRFYDSPVRLAELVYRRVFDRFPELRMVFAEVDVGWLPYLKEQLDDRYSRQNPADKLKLELKPSEYLERNVSYTLVKDAYGIRNRHAIGVSQILWSSDFPHASCDHPHYARAIARDFPGVPADELHAMLAVNAARLYFGSN